MTLPRQVVVPLMLACAGAARAAPPPDSFSDLSLEELGRINVSAASLLPASLLDAASTVAPITQEDWQRRGARRLFDALETQPALNVLPHLSGSQSVVMRAMVPSGSPAGVALTWDDAPLTDLMRSSTQYMSGLNLGALGQVQVIQGPGSALYGSDAFHGLVALRSPEPSGAAGGRAGLAARSDGFGEAYVQDARTLDGGARLRLAAAANVQAAQALQAPAAAGQALQRDNRQQAQTASLRMLSDTEQDTTWHAGLYLHRYYIKDSNGIGTRASGGNDMGWSRTRFAMLQAGLRHSFSVARSLELKGYYWRADSTIGSVVAAAPSAQLRDLLAGQHRAGLQATWRDTLPALRTEYALSAGLERLAVDEAYSELRSLGGQYLNRLANPTEGARRNVRQATLEANTRWADGRWRLVYGGRLDHYSDFGSHGSPRLGLVFQPAPENALKLLYGQAFRAPSAQEQAGTPNSILPNPGLKPEIIDTLELVAVHQGDSLTAQATLFRSLWRDGIVSQLLPSNRLVQFVNADRNKSYGLGASLRYRAGSLLLELDGSFARGRNQPSGREFRTFPRAKLVAAAAWSLADPSWQLTLDQHWQSKVNDVSAGAVFAARGLPHYARTDIGVGKRLSPQTEVAFQVRNLADRHNIYTSPSGARGGIPDSGITGAITLRRVY
ncbi:TonB-dependent receptor [Massilia sp. SR12]